MNRRSSTYQTGDDFQRIHGLLAAVEELVTRLARERYLRAAGLDSTTSEAEILHHHGGCVSREALALVERHLLAIAPRPDPVDPMAPIPTPAAIPSIVALAHEGTEAEARQLRALREVLATELLHAKRQSITDSLAAREDEALITVSSGVAPGEAPRTLSFREARAAIASEPERARRQELSRKRLKVVEKLQPLLAERQAVTHAFATSLGYEDHVASWQALSGIDLGALTTELDGFLARTRDMYFETMDWLVRKRTGLALKDASSSDVAWLFGTPRFDAHFPSWGLEETARRLLREMGIDLEQKENLIFDLEPRDAKASRAFVAELRVPAEIVLCATPTTGRASWRRFFHQLGRALTFAYTSASEPFAFRHFGDASLTESHAFLFQNLLLNPKWLKRYVEMHRAKDYLFLSGLERLASLRWDAARLRYEIELRQTRVAPGDLDEAPERYAMHLQAAIGVPCPSALYLYDLDPSFRSARGLRASMAAALMQTNLVGRFDEDWYRNPRCGEFLSNGWLCGSRYSLEERLGDLGCGALDTRELERQIQRAL